LALKIRRSVSPCGRDGVCVEVSPRLADHRSLHPHKADGGELRQFCLQWLDNVYRTCEQGQLRLPGHAGKPPENTAENRGEKLAEKWMAEK
jgi:hypothetical protein